ncbi:MAG: SusD/RagB family nutrient-binding outer membrane lipoprotein [Sphingobacteriales bacterium]|nr:MAG: SusD/RagB family nutrient-binding outer membrane lipoprotein [Sphingobacteriales bacterium]
MRRISIVSLLLLVMFTSCKKYLDINQTPNNPLNVPASTILPTATVAVAFANSNDLNRATSAIVQHIAGVANQTAAYDVYNLDGSFDNQWNFEIYNGAVNNLQILIDQNSANNPAYSGIAKLQLAYIISVAADIWGDVPYSQAGQGLKYEQPRFDKVQDIYQGNSGLNITSLFDLVKSGLADLTKTSTLKPGTDDIVYKGDLTKWTRMGNTLLLKLAIQLTNVNPTLAKSTISSVLTANTYINANNLDFEVPFGPSVGNQNAIYTFNTLNRPGDQMLSSRFLALERSLNDTVRLAKLFTKPNNVFTSYDNGSTAAAPTNANRSKYNTFFTGATGEAPIRLLTNAQVNFILAEAALVLGTTGDANAYYQAGIRAHMSKIGMTTAEIDNYFNTNPSVVTLSGTNDDKLKQIITQKYISLVGNGIEAFNDYRRTGYPVLALPLNAAGDNPNVIPTRLPYTPAELARNPNAPNPRPKTDVKLWWAK